MSFMKRVVKDAIELCNKPPSGIAAFMDEEDATLIHLLIIGPEKTPYEGGSFYFTMKCLEQYPFSPPQVKHMSTAGNTVRFNPNLYLCGKVCISILGTAPGPGWAPVMNLVGVALTIQSLLCEKPYHNIPSCEKEKRPGIAEYYNNIIRHETIRVAVCDVLDKKYFYPEKFRKFMVAKFFKNYETLVNICNSKKQLDGKDARDQFGCNRITFNFSALIERLKKLKSQISESEGDDSWPPNE